ncbi:helix-turn-helix domain-containing protein [Jatrophihabitans telluris]|uniref:Helix-turn-helix domain-containing protein n=1 Tax=Jatrophihabitans telluris TaxID=2038343 RepID=A0ABY4R0X9_9ACTN|nr:helix-turn-helix domain-containing protein [Jatrophihabitans telluris]UQX89561.1 helix-turn-helix domain-containing protein [Jatrophihabitans telluris]
MDSSDSRSEVDAVLLVSAGTDPGRRQALEELADAAGVGLSWVQPGQSLPDAAGGAADTAATAATAATADIADLAQTIATLTGGLVTIEDTAARVLGYSRSGEDVDDLRRLSILERSGPERYLALLREWGVYDRLAASEDVVEIAEHPESGVRRRLAVGIFAGARQLGTIWVQQGRSDFPPHARQALLGAARLAAAALLDRAGPDRVPSNAELVRRQLQSGRVGPDPGPKPRPRTVISFVPAPGRDATETRQRRQDLQSVVGVHGAAYRRDALAGEFDGQVQLLVPGGTDRLPAMVRALIGSAKARYGFAVRAGIGPTVEEAELGRSLRGAQLALSLGTASVTTFGEVRPLALIRAAEEKVAAVPELHDSRVDALIAEEPELARTLLTHLRSGAQVSATAADLGIHQTTVRYRLRRITELTGIDLSDADQCLATQLQLRVRAHPPVGGA